LLVFGTRLSWIIVGAVVALVVLASVDALRSPDDESAADTELTTADLDTGGGTDTRAVGSASTEVGTASTRSSTCTSALTFGSGTPDRTFTGDGDGDSATSEDGYSFTYPGEWARRGERDEVDRRGYGRFFTTAFAPDAETACSAGFAPDLTSRGLPGRAIFAPGPDALVLFEIGHEPGNDLACDWINPRTTLREIQPCVDEYLVQGQLREREGVRDGLTLVTVAGLPAVRSRIDLGSGVTLQETMIFDRTAWYFLACRFSSEDMEGGCDQVEETFETVDEVVDEGGNTLPGCTRRQIIVSVTAREDGDHWDGSLLVVPVTDRCRKGYQYFRMMVIDGRGRRGAWGRWSGPLQHTSSSSSHAAVRRFPCDRPGPLIAVVTMGPNPAPRFPPGWGMSNAASQGELSQGELFRAQVKCL
jgi:hypothetical protein